MRRQPGLNNVNPHKERKGEQEETSQGQDERTFDRAEYSVGWICALPIELAAAQVMRDEKDGQIGVAEGDTNSYVLGRIATHCVVMTCLPQGTVGTNAAATVATNMTRSFPRLRFILLVGVGAGAPDPRHTDMVDDIHLGDVVVSKPDTKNGGVIQYDFGKTVQSGIVENGKTFNKPPSILRTAVARLEALHLTEGSGINDILQATYRSYPRIQNKFRPPGALDLLFQADYEHVKGELDCHSCQSQYIVPRQSRVDTTPVIHYGLIASANQVMRSAPTREKLRRDLGVICFEMEAAGMMDDCPCLVVRGICDYADSHKNKEWQPYAALTAAAYAKELLQSMERSSVYNESVVELVGTLNEHLDRVQLHHTRQEEHLRRQETQYQNDKERDCHRAFKTSSYEGYKNINPERAQKTCQWLLGHEKYLQWQRTRHSDLLWISADPGCGKSVLARSLVDENNLDASVCYFFFKDNDEQSGLATALSAVLHQLFTQQPQLIQHAIPAWEKNGKMITSEVDELWRILQAAVADPRAQSVLCVLDALDECRDTDRRDLILMLCQFYNIIARTPSANGRLKFLVTSRPYEDIEQNFGHITASLPSIRLRGEDENDLLRGEIDFVVRARVQTITQDLPLVSSTAERLEQKLLSMEHRTYLWLDLAIDSIRKTFSQSLRPDHESLELVPESVDEAYEQILSKVDQKQTTVVRTILQIIVGAYRPLTIGEMALALDVATSKTIPRSFSDFSVNEKHLQSQIRHWCGLFVFINNSRLYLIHQTAKEFLLYDGQKIWIDNGHWKWKHCFTMTDIDRNMARILILYLCLQEFNREDFRIDDLSCGLERLPFQNRQDIDGGYMSQRVQHQQELFRLAATSWSDHWRNIEDTVRGDLVNKAWTLYDTRSQCFSQWTKVMWQTRRPHWKAPEMTDLIQAAYSGHVNIVRRILNVDPHGVKVRDQSGMTALMRGAEMGHYSVVGLLLDKGADVNARGGYYGSASYARGEYYGNALDVASAGGHEKVVQILVENGADVNAQGGQHGNALQAASVRGHEKVVQILVDNGVDVNARGGYYGTAFYYKGRYCGNALYAASAGGHEKVVQILVDNGADVNAQGGQHGNALQAASVRGHEKVVQILLDNGADVNARGRQYRNALQAASLRGHEKVVQMLLDNGADVG